MTFRPVDGKGSGVPLVTGGQAIDKVADSGGFDMQRPTLSWTAAASVPGPASRKPFVRPQNVFTFELIRGAIPGIDSALEKHLPATTKLVLGPNDTLTTKSRSCPTQSVQLRIPREVEAYVVD